MLLAAVLLVLLSSASGADDSDDNDIRREVSVKKCKTAEVVKNLDIGKLRGKWFEWASYGSLMMVPDHRCQVGFWYPSADGKSIDALFDFITPSEKPDTLLTHQRTTWKIKDEDPAPDGNLVAGIDTISFGHQELPARVLATDYDKFLLIHMCKKIATFDYSAGFILTRKNSYSPEDIKAMDGKINEALKLNGIAQDRFVSAIQQPKCDNVTFATTYEEPVAQGKDGVKS